MCAMQGVLYKEGRGIIKRHKKRWFVLGDGDNSLRYYKSQHSGNIRGKVDLDGILSVESSTEDSYNKKNCYGFTITTARRVLNVFARTSLERGYWVNGLNKRLTNKKNRLSVKNHIHFLTMPQIKPHLDMVKGNTGGGGGGAGGGEDEPTGARKRMITTRSKSESELIPVDKERMLRPKSVAFALADVTKEETFQPPSIEISEAPPTPKESIQEEPKPRRESRSPAPILRRETYSSPSKQLSLPSPPSPPSSPDDGMLLVDSDQEDPELLIQRIKDLQRRCEDQHSQIAALATLVEKPSGKSSQGSQRRSQKITASERKGKFQAEKNQFVGIGMWLESKKKSDLENTVSELTERLQQALSRLEDEHKKVQYLEESRQELLGQLKQLEEEKERLKYLVKSSF